MRRSGTTPPRAALLRYGPLTTGALMATKEAQTARAVPTGPTRMTPSEAFVETLVANGVTDMFGIMGSAFMDAMDIFAPAGLRLIPVGPEQGSGPLSDGHAPGRRR